MIAVPVALIGTFFFLQIFGFSINLLTLSALLLAIAIVVDDAIVVVEAVHAKLDAGYQSSLTAAIDAMNEISGAIISITLVMASVFVPVSFIGGTSGTFYKEFGVTMAVSIVISALNATTLSPALCAMFLKPHKKDEDETNKTFVARFHAGFNRVFDKTVNKYKKGVEHVINHRIITGVVVVVGIALLVIGMKVTKTGLVHDEDTGTIFVTLSAKPGTSQERTQKIVEEVDKMLASNWLSCTVTLSWVTTSLPVGVPTRLRLSSSLNPSMSVPAVSLPVSSVPSRRKTPWRCWSILMSRTRCSV